MYTVVGAIQSINLTNTSRIGWDHWGVTGLQRSHRLKAEELASILASTGNSRSSSVLFTVIIDSNLPIHSHLASAYHRVEDNNSSSQHWRPSFKWQSFVLLGKGGRGCLQSWVSTTWHSIWKLNLIQVETFCREEKTKGLQWLQSLLGLLKVRLSPGQNAPTKMVMTTPEKAL